MDKFIKLEQELYDRLIKWVKKAQTEKENAVKNIV